MAQLTTSPQKATRPPSGFSRRDFLRGSGAVAAATAVHQQATAIAQEVKAAAVPISGEQSIDLDVNGKPVKVKAEPRTTLLDVLRLQLDLTGAKPICTDGSSGGATVLVDGKPMQANMMLAMQAVGKKIQTVESLVGDAVPNAFVACDAQQCGFCTPGFVVAVRAFLNQKPKATEEEIRAGLNGNLCRCGTYANIIHAALMVVKGGTNG
ncbi:MAG: (2Fe-2S)-binding protein [Planctomycetaceae bacterium]|nr:(2Fe-2S)-binding protein [Planctomycetaceae bacterium]